MDNVHIQLHPMFDLAVRDDIIRKNLSDGVMAEIKMNSAEFRRKRHALTAPQQKAFIDEFIQKVELEYDEYLEQERIEEQKAYEKKITSGVPFVGMSEKDINRTSLGKPSSEIRHNKECINGEQYIANLYDFYNGSDKVFIARCVQGKVTDVWDYRDNPISQSTKPYTSNSTKKESDPYDASDYSDPEDFYYDYYDDFWDYEEAEDYWNEYSDY